MKIFKKFIKKNISEVLKEEDVYTIRKEELCYLVTTAIKAQVELNKMQMDVNVIKGKLIDGHSIDYNLVCLEGDLRINEARMKDFLAILPNPYQESPGEV